MRARESRNRLEGEFHLAYRVEEFQNLASSAKYSVLGYHTVSRDGKYWFRITTDEVNPVIKVKQKQI